MNFHFSLKCFVDDAETQVYAIYEKDQEAARAAAAKVTRVLSCTICTVLLYIRYPIVAMHMINVYSEQ